MTCGRGLIINASGDYRLGNTTITGSEFPLVVAIYQLGLRSSDHLPIPIGLKEIESRLATAQRIIRKLGIDRE